jgi:hypothetical protein
MRKKTRSTKGIQVTVGGDVSGQLAAGENITQMSTKTTPQVTQAELEEFRQLLTTLRAKIEVDVPSEKQEAALERVGELEHAITEKKPDLSTMEYVRNWFVKNLPGLAGAVTGVVVHPLVGKLVEAGGDTLVNEFRRRFGGASS